MHPYRIGLERLICTRTTSPYRLVITLGKRDLLVSTSDIPHVIGFSNVRDELIGTTLRNTSKILYAVNLL